MRLHTLLRDIPELDIGGLADLEIKALTADSRQVVPGALFVAVRGMVSDGHDYLPKQSHVERQPYWARNQIHRSGFHIFVFAIRKRV